MLNDDERRALADLERHLQHDPEFAARMDGLAATPTVPAFPVVPVLCAGLFIAVPLVMMLFGWAGVIILLYAFATAIAVVVFRRL